MMSEQEEPTPAGKEWAPGVRANRVTVTGDSVVAGNSTRPPTRVMALVSAYQALGWKLFPVHSWWGDGCSCRRGERCREPAKHPVAHLAPNGVKNATNMIHILNEWFGGAEQWNIGLACGRDSGVVAVDIDPRHNGDTSWTMWTFENKVIIPTTRRSITGGGGSHLFFSYVEGLINRNNVLRGVDFKTDGGYVILPPSSHASGREYEWPDDATTTHPLAAMPPALIDLISTSRGSGGSGERLPDPKSILAGVPEGKRDDVLFRWGCQLRRLLGDDARDLITHLVVSAAASCQPPLPEDQALKCVEQAYKQDHTDGGEALGPDSIRQSHGGNGVRFARRFGSEVLYVAGVGWYGWDATVWTPRQEVEVEALAKQIVDDLYEQVRAPGLDSRDKGRASRWAVQSDSPAGVAGMLKMARSDTGLLRYPSDLNTDPLKLATANGVVDLRTGELMKLSRHDLITNRSPLPYDAAHPRPRWEAFVKWAMCGDDELVAFLQRLAGYSITGLFTEHVFPVMLGPGGNGKNTFVETLISVLGSLSEFPFPADAITTRDTDDKRTALLFGKRLAVISETNKRVEINSATLKSYTGDGQLLGKRLYQDPFTFTSTHTLWFMSNHRPKITDDSDGIWRRVLLVPWQAKVAEQEKVPRYHELLLREEGPGIVAWLVEGALRYLRDGLMVPSSIRAASEEYRKAEDVLGEFMADCLVVGQEHTISRAQLNAAYDGWCFENNIPPRERAGIRDLIDSIGLRVSINPNCRIGAGPRVIRGIGLLPSQAMSWPGVLPS